MKKLKYILIALFSMAVIGVAVGLNWQNDQNPLASEKAYSINKTWEMPKALDEISGIAWLEDDIIASVQDEDGIIFIYDLSSNKIIQEIEFADQGDYEGIAINDQDAYVMRSDGVVFEILNFRSKDKKVSQFKTDFSEDQNMETLFYDRNTKSLITTPKDEGLKSEANKGLYRIALDTKKMDSKAFINIDMNDSALEEFQNKKIEKTFNPSDLAIHPKTGNYYILEGKNPKLMILDPKGNIKNVYVLNEDDFPQPEGLSFESEGRLYISNEASKGASATILQVDFN
ncbi:hypothetical protein ESY86_16465 [Subsaximicrobium wynnwilliamsii]|uniref:SdiA-regulated family protein n=1 Tax=Subsaximicrobium wynnwilliamsii TaxID=291179 RepID=A0A5C6ZCV2_9FLAO|nr:SdiA-regulated domain-containing protein [Subsaximicrobium wynnwilliamsii]TXD81795.1 hypothetical protein ESY87_16960 [Subsaximicrobium wynnwilliamsii]TXD87621.1 hypothetical protein ESY86_16465 [Subsaximicrobium wynnwilliamsii]TXE01294.1 hypothetical protein ESY88_16715 [Subsaximicrobium wynnwilliamsii]